MGKLNNGNLMLNQQTMSSGLKAVPFILSLFFLNANILKATNYYVNDNSTTGDIYCTAVGNNANNGTSATTPKATLSNVWTTYGPAGTNVLVAGDVIYVDAGTYADKTLTITKDITIQGAGIGVTIFKVTTNNNYFMYINANVNLDDFSVTGYGDPGNNLGQAITINSTSSASSYSVNLNAINIYNCGAAQGYASILINKNSTVNITQGSATCSWTSAAATGGIDVVGTNCNVVISNYLLYGNWKYAYNNVSQGGALSITGANSTTTVTVSQTNFTSNEVNNGSDGWGGAIYQTSGNLVIYDCLFNSNKVYNNSGNTYGEAIAIIGGYAHISGSNFTGNQNDNGGSNNYGGAIYATGTTTVSVDSCTFTSNSADASRGLDIYSAVSGSNFIVNHSLFNSSSNYDIVAATSTITVTNSGTPTHNGSTINISGGSFTPNTPTVVTYSGSCPSSIIVLPIELTQFEGHCINNQITLIWQTATETNNKVFNIERSFDGVNFIVIGRVNGAGNSTNFINYSFVDNSLKSNANAYYRLDQQDYNGKSSQSEIIFVEHTCEAKTNIEISLFPNPASKQVALNLTLFQSTSITVEMQNDMGQMVKTVPVQLLDIGIQTMRVDVADLPQGVYFFTIISNSEKYIRKLIKL